ncbi:MAG: transcriptional repressor [Clostridia bacterium]|nr:transcriptional repressor [Clostridia bacterium]
MNQRRYSKKREAILRIVSSTKSHPSAKWVYDQIQKEYLDISLATVYRNLALFKQDGRVACIAVVDGEERFDGNVEPHSHFVCRSCGKIIDLDLETFHHLEREVEHQTGASVDSSSILFYGTCADCKRF